MHFSLITFHLDIYLLFKKKKKDIALDLLQHYPGIPLIHTIDGVSPMFALAQKPSAFYSRNPPKFFVRCFYNCKLAFAFSQTQLYSMVFTVNFLLFFNMNRINKINVIIIMDACTRKCYYIYIHRNMINRKQILSERKQLFVIHVIKL